MSGAARSLEFGYFGEVGWVDQPFGLGLLRARAVDQHDIIGSRIGAQLGQHLGLGIEVIVLDRDACRRGKILEREGFIRAVAFPIEHGDLGCGSGPARRGDREQPRPKGAAENGVKGPAAEMSSHGFDSLLSVVTVSFDQALFSDYVASRPRHQEGIQLLSCWGGGRPQTRD